MRVPLSWIRDFTPADAPVDELVAALNQLGLEVEGVEAPGTEVLGVRVARILEVLPHPDADRLQLADVDFGEGTTRVVCGAPNIAPGMVVPFAPSGASLPGGFTLERRKIRGQESDGMLCSAKELGLGEDHAGILELDAAAQLGTDVRELLGLDDVVFDLSITPNRPDAMCVVGVARELAAHLGQPLTVPEPPLPGPGAATDASATADVSVVIEAPDRCPRYLAWTAQVTLGPSPAWLQQRLVKAGMRPISNVVDVTNYVLLERNQPLHAFDLGRLAGPGIVVRLAAAGERMTTLDDVERGLDPSDLLICDAERTPQAIAGIMGGATAEVGDATTEILLESAYFERMGIARSSKRLKLRSEASARFERGIDPDAVGVNAARAMELLRRGRRCTASRPRPRTSTPHPSRGPGSRCARARSTACWAPTSPTGPCSTRSRPSASRYRAVATRSSRFRRASGRTWSVRSTSSRRSPVGSASRRSVAPSRSPSTRSARSPMHNGTAAPWRTRWSALGSPRRYCVPLVAPGALDAFGTTAPVVAANPLRAEESVLRTTLLPGLLASTAFNIARGQSAVALFELGQRSSSPRPRVTCCRTSASTSAAVLAGVQPRRPIEPDRPVDATTRPTWCTSSPMRSGARTSRSRGVADPGWHPLRSARIVAGGVEIGAVGELAPSVARRVQGSKARSSRSSSTSGRSRPRPATSWASAHRRRSRPRTSTWRSSSTTPWRPARSPRRSAPPAGELLEDVRAFDEFRSEALGAGRKSVAFALRFRAPDRTLTDAEVGTLRRQAIDAVTAAHAATLRA